jgi:predicted metalloendopeptidase
MWTKALVSKSCASRTSKEVRHSAGWILGYFWVRWHLPSDIRSFGNHVVSTIREEYLGQLETLEWMSANTKSLAAKKRKFTIPGHTVAFLMNVVQDMTQEIAYPTRNPNLSNATEIEALYGQTGISKLDYFQNVIFFAQAKNHERFAKLAKSSEDRDWDRRVDTIDVSGASIILSTLAEPLDIAS